MPYPMAFHITTSIKEEQSKFLKEHHISPSKLIQDGIDDLMKIQDPELFQQTLDNMDKKAIKESIWQKGLNNEPDFEKRKMIVFEFLDNIGIDTKDWKERKEIKK